MSEIGRIDGDDQGTACPFCRFVYTYTCTRHELDLMLPVLLAHLKGFSVDWANDNRAPQMFFLHCDLSPDELRAAHGTPVTVLDCVAAGLCSQ